MKVPVYIISFNRLTCLQQLVAWLESAEMAQPVIIDNGSTYPPLLDWFERMKNDIVIRTFKDNYGPYRVWDEKLFESHTTPDQPFYVVTDPDIIPIAACPKDAIPQLVDAYKRNRLAKVGLSLSLDAIPDSLPTRHDIRAWETQMQSQFVGVPDPAIPRCYASMLDTTFQVNHRDLLPPSCGSGGLRLAHPYQADHVGWNVDPENLSDEDKFYWKTASHRASTIQTLKDRGLPGNDH